MNIKLTSEKINAVKNFLSQNLTDEYWAKQRISTGREIPDDFMTIYKTRIQREGAVELLNDLGIGIDFDFDCCNVELWDIKTQEVIK